MAFINVVVSNVENTTTLISFISFRIMTLHTGRHQRNFSYKNVKLIAKCQRDNHIDFILAFILARCVYHFSISRELNSDALMDKNSTLHSD